MENQAPLVLGQAALKKSLFPGKHVAVISRVADSAVCLWGNEKALCVCVHVCTCVHVSACGRYVCVSGHTCLCTHLCVCVSVRVQCLHLCVNV